MRPIRCLQPARISPCNLENESTGIRRKLFSQRRIRKHDYDFMKFRLRSVVGELGRGAEGGEKRLANRSRRATPAAAPQTEARRDCGHLRMLARDERACREAWQAKRGERSPVHRPERALVTASQGFIQI